MFVPAPPSLAISTGAGRRPQEGAAVRQTLRYSVCSLADPSVSLDTTHAGRDAVRAVAWGNGRLPWYVHSRPSQGQVYFWRSLVPWTNARSRTARLSSRATRATPRRVRTPVV